MAFDPVLYALLLEMVESGGGGSSSGYKGTIASASNLPASGNQGDIYRVSDEGIFYVYDNGWKPVTQVAITNAQIDALWP